MKTSINSLNNKSPAVMIIVSVLLVIMDIFTSFLNGILMYLVCFLLCGLDSAFAKHMGPVIMTETAVIHCYTAGCLKYPRINKFLKRSSVWVCWFCYYGYLFGMAVVSSYITWYIIGFVWSTSVTDDNGNVIAFKFLDYSTLRTMIAEHQLLTFVILTSHNTWFGGHLLKNTDPWAAAILQFGVTWIVWGIFISKMFNPVHNNLPEIGGFLQWIPLTNLMTVSIFKGVDFGYKNISTRAGWTAFLTNCVNCFYWGFSYAVTYAIYKNDVHVTVSPSEMGHMIWAFSVLSWPAMEIVGQRLSPLFFEKMCVRSKSKFRFGYSIPMLGLYFLICVVLQCIISVILFLLYHYIIYDGLFCEVITGRFDHQPVEVVTACKNDPWLGRALYMYALGTGTIYIAYVEMKEFSKDAVEDEPHHPDHKHVEAQLKLKQEQDNGLEPTATTTPANIA